MDKMANLETTVKKVLQELLAREDHVDQLENKDHQERKD